MANINKNEEVIIDFEKILKIIWFRKKIVIFNFIVILIVMIFFILSSSKKYETEAKILLNKSSSTNLSDINPFVVSEITTNSGGMASFLTGGGSNLANEIEIIQSPLVLDKVIKKNNLKYKKGKKKGEYISAKNLLSNNLKIANIKGTNIFTISYKSSTPDGAFNIVNSIIDSYKRVNEEINYKKAMQDSKLLEKEYSRIKNSLEKKLNLLKQNKLNMIQPSQNGVSDNFNLLSFYDKRYDNSLKQLSNDGLDFKKSNIEIEQLTDQLNLIKIKLEWSHLVKDMAKAATNITVLEKPNIPKAFEFQKPRLIINIILSQLIFIFISLFTLLMIENNDKKLTYSDMSESSKLITKNKINFLDLKSDVYTKGINSIRVIALIEKDMEIQFINLLKNEFNQEINISILSENDLLQNYIKEIKNAELLIILTKMGYSDRLLSNKIRNLADLNKGLVYDFTIT